MSVSAFSDVVKARVMAVRREITVREAAEAVGCTSKYMDKKVRERRRAS